jgi:hypothetical protein
VPLAVSGRESLDVGLPAVHQLFYDIPDVAHDFLSPFNTNNQSTLVLQSLSSRTPSTPFLCPPRG